MFSVFRSLLTFRYKQRCVCVCVLLDLIHADRAANGNLGSDFHTCRLRGHQQGTLAVCVHMSGSVRVAYYVEYVEAGILSL